MSDDPLLDVYVGSLWFQFTEDGETLELSVWGPEEYEPEIGPTHPLLYQLSFSSREGYEAAFRAAQTLEAVLFLAEEVDEDE